MYFEGVGKQEMYWTVIEPNVSRPADNSDLQIIICTTYNWSSCKMTEQLFFSLRKASSAKPRIPMEILVSKIIFIRKTA